MGKRDSLTDAEKPQAPPDSAELTLNARQQKFVDLYDGNGTESARKAGYTGSDSVLGKTAHDLLRNPKIKTALKAREKIEKRKRIATRQERQAFWTRSMNDKKEPLRDRLRASELLGKSEADFTEKHEHSGPDGKPIQLQPVSALTDAELDARIAALEAKARKS